LQYQKKLIKKEVKRNMMDGLDKNELVVLTFALAEAKSQLKWEHSKEFEYKGQMYDIVETIFSGDSVTYLCWWDNEETQLNKQLSKLVSESLGNNPQNKENKKRLLSFFKSIYTPLPSFSLNTLYQSVNKPPLTTYSFFYSLDGKSPLHPPPKKA
jgi:hypothetical protein